MLSFLFFFFIKGMSSRSILSLHLNKDSITTLEVIYYGSLSEKLQQKITKKKKTVVTEKPGNLVMLKPHSPWAKYAISN